MNDLDRAESQLDSVVKVLSYCKINRVMTLAKS